jgi:predicted nucleic acid-binding protein
VVDVRRAIADTSVFIGFEQRRFDDQSLADLELGVSVVTLGELRLGVLSARHDPDAAARRLATYELARQFEPLPIDEPVSDAWALLVAKLRADGRKAPISPSAPRTAATTPCPASSSSRFEYYSGQGCQRT